GIPDIRCDGTILRSCDPRTTKARTSFECGWLGLACGKGGGGYTTCITPGGDLRDGGPECPVLGTTQCAGPTLRACTIWNEYQWTTFECGEVGASCRGGGIQVPAFCLPPGAECTPTDRDVGTCDEAGIVLCLGGSRITFDCSSVSLACDSAAKACR